MAGVSWISRCKDCESEWTTTLEPGREDEALMQSLTTCPKCGSNLVSGRRADIGEEE
jgi:hypothetical protein